MREYKFRGYIPRFLGMKGYFVYGLLVRKIDDVYTILSNDKFYAVPCENIGQFTGLHDKNGVEIYEGDIVIHTNFPNDKQEVRFEDGCFVVHKMALYSYHKSVIEVIGNTHEEVVE